MLEEFIAAPAVERMRASLFGAHLDALCGLLHGQGYAQFTIREKLREVVRLAAWMGRKRLGIVELNERRIAEFLGEEHRHGRCRRGDGTTLLGLLAQLRSVGAVPEPTPVRDDSPGAALLARYEEHLRRDRALAASSITRFGRIASQFVSERSDAVRARPSALHADDIRAFVVETARRLSPKSAQMVAAAMRSFLRFLFLRGETAVDLALAIPMVRQQRYVSVPRHLPAEDVERLLASCDLASPTGRRDYALLLLLARLGLRAGEVMALRLGDVRWREAEIIVRGKGQVQDKLPLLPDVGTALASYLHKDRPAGPSRQLFVCRKAPHRGFSHPSSVSTIVMRTLKRAGLTPPTRGAHLLRHSLATAMLRRGASFAEIGQILRHQSARTTEIYAKVDLAALRDVARPWPCLGGAR